MSDSRTRSNFAEALVTASIIGLTNPQTEVGASGAVADGGGEVERRERHEVETAQKVVPVPGPQRRARVIGAQFNVS